MITRIQIYALFWILFPAILLSGCEAQKSPNPDKTKKTQEGKTDKDGKGKDDKDGKEKAEIAAPTKLALKHEVVPTEDGKKVCVVKVQLTWEVDDASYVSIWHAKDEKSDALDKKDLKEENENKLETQVEIPEGESRTFYIQATLIEDEKKKSTVVPFEPSLACESKDDKSKRQSGTVKEPKINQDEKHIHITLDLKDKQKVFAIVSEEALKDDYAFCTHPDIKPIELKIQAGVGKTGQLDIPKNDNPFWIYIVGQKEDESCHKLASFEITKDAPVTQESPLASLQSNQINTKITPQDLDDDENFVLELQWEITATDIDMSKLVANIQLVNQSDETETVDFNGNAENPFSFVVDKAHVGKKFSVKIQFTSQEPEGQSPWLPLADTIELIAQPEA